MKTLSITWAFLVSLLPLSFAKAPENDDEKKLLIATQKFWDAMDQLDIDQIVDLTHPSLFKISGGKENFTIHLKRVKAEMDQKESKVTESSLGTPSKIHDLGDKQVVFVPRSYAIDRGDHLAKIETFAIAIRPKKDESWKFVDSGFFGPDPKGIFEFIPKLPKNIQFPTSKITRTDIAKE